MDLSLLRGFAAGVRVELVGVVGARLAGVLLPGSVERVEFPEAVRRLESVVARSGRDVVVDQVAYTWFNRLVALRFMDVNGYTGVGVVSPAGGAVAGQPEVLADAKAGHVDVGVVGEKVRDRVIGLLSGSVVSGDAQGEAFKLLLAAYCNHWAGPMPFMFERSGDFTELLVPDDLLSDRSIVARILRTLTPEVCSDVEVIGWLYQFYIAARKDEVFAGFKKNKKATALEIPAATQLFTPHWIVKYLVENSLGRLWLLNNPGSDLASRMEYYIAPVEPETDFLKISGPEDLRVLDPACGSGHMLTYAFDLLFLMYEEAGYAPSDIPGLILKHNLFGAEIDPRAGALAAFALVMKARDKQKAFLNPGKGTAPNICVLEPVRFAAEELEMLVTRGGDKHAEVAFWQSFEDADTFGSLIRPDQDLITPLTAQVESLGEAETLFGGDVLDRARTVLEQSVYLSTRYHVVVANPPYMGSGNMGPRLAEFAKREYPDTKADLYAMFIERGFQLSIAAGYSAMVTMESWMFLATYGKLRGFIVALKPILSMVHMPYLGKGRTSMGISFGTSATIFLNAPLPETKGTYQCLRYYESDPSGTPLSFPIENERSATVPTTDFDVVPGSPIVYWLSERLKAAFSIGKPLNSVVDPKLGLYTGDDERFLRYWHEVSFNSLALGVSTREEAKTTNSTWFPCNKGGPGRRWYGNHELVINWRDDGKELFSFSPRSGIRNPQFYFRPSVSWSLLTTAAPAFRYYPAGFIFTGKGPSIFSDSDDRALEILAFANSPLARQMLGAMSPTIGYEVGHIANLPIVPMETAQVRRDVKELVDLSKHDWDGSEVSWEFASHELVERFRKPAAMREAHSRLIEEWNHITERAAMLERRICDEVNNLYGVSSAEAGSFGAASVTLTRNAAFQYGADLGTPEANDRLLRDSIRDFVSYGVGCMFGRYSLDLPGLVLANQGDSLADYLAKVPSPSFMPDEDNVLPVLSDGWFEDDIVERFREFLKVSFAEEHFEENLRFVEDALGKDIRKYLVQDFYKDHVQRYKKRPIYWLFSSPKGSFNALIYMHRYKPDTVSVVLNDYLHEFQAKLRARRANLDQVAVSTLSTAKEQTAARKESEQIGKMLLELEEWEQSVLYPLATEQIHIDLDDGVKANYPKFGTALNNKFTGF